jgi:hypothetical protein
MLFNYILYTALPFLDNFSVKGPRSTYNNKEIKPGIRRYIAEHIMNLDGVLANIKRAGITVAVKKL